MVLFCLVAGVVLPIAAGAEVKVASRLETALEKPPLAVAVAADGSTVAVLQEGGLVTLFANTGQPRGTVTVSEHSSAIAISSDGGRLFVTDGSTGKLQIVAVDFIAELNTANTPYVRGPADAPVTIVVFSDFQCPYSSRLNPVLKEVLKRYDGKVRLVYKFLPLKSIHPQAEAAAKAAMAAEKQGKFWEYHDALLESYQELSEEKFVEIAARLGLDVKRFQWDRKDPRFVNYLKNDADEAATNHIRSVPSVFINGRPLRNRSLEGFTTVIDQELGDVSG
jgi:protein-disulfide isomerase